MGLNFTIVHTEESKSHKNWRLSDKHKLTDNMARDKRREKARKSPTTFIGVDGEGVTLPDGKHIYVLLTVGSQHIENSNGLEFSEIMSFVWSQFKPGQKTAYVGFFLGYDFLEWVKTLPEDRARMLLTQEGIKARAPKTSKWTAPFPVRYDGWEFDIMPGAKKFRLRPDKGYGLEHSAAQKARMSDKTPFMHICDCGPFFQKAFLKVIDPKEWHEYIVSAEEFLKVQAGKERRADAVLDDTMREYNALENELLSRVMGKLEAGFKDLGIHLNPDQWYGPGQAAQAWLNGKFISRAKLAETLNLVRTWDDRPAETILSARQIASKAGSHNPAANVFFEAARQSYYGGWFEIFQHGLLSGDSYEYDINSAYPYRISRMPCLQHGTYSYGNGNPQLALIRDTDLCLIRARVSTPDNQKIIGAMTHREKNGRIKRPLTTEGWYWLHEYKAAVRAGIIDDNKTVWHDWTVYHPCDCEPPLSEVEKIYDKRKQVGKKTPLGMACKLMPNSLYGKFAQSQGSPKFANPVYASLITAGCRVQILEAIATHPIGISDVVMIATDGVYFRSRHNKLQCCEKPCKQCKRAIPGDKNHTHCERENKDSCLCGQLGYWEEGLMKDLYLFKPGVYWTRKTLEELRDGNKPRFKARGINIEEFSKHLERIQYQIQQIGFEALVMSRNSLVSNDEFNKWIKDGKPMPVKDHWPLVRYSPKFSLITAKQALQRNDWTLAAQRMTGPVDSGTGLPTEFNIVQSSDPSDKRTNPRWISDSSLSTEAYPVGQTCEISTPYQKKFGADDLDNPNSEMYREQFGIGPDGYTGQALWQMLE